MVERVLFSNWSKVLLKRFPSLDCAIGIGFSDRQLDLFAAVIAERTELYGFPPRSADVKGWDRTVSDWMLDADIAVVSSLVPLLGYSKWKSAALSWSVTAANCSYYVDGSIYYKVVPGLTISGSYRTTHSNSVMRLIIAHLAGSSAVVCGDDSLEWNTLSTQDLVSRYAALGFSLRDVQEHAVGAFSFCSHDFREAFHGTTASLSTWPKSLFKLLSGACDGEQVAAFYYETRYNDEVDVGRCRQTIDNKLCGM
jgi:hypothetical protein